MWWRRLLKWLSIAVLVVVVVALIVVWPATVSFGQDLEQLRSAVVRVHGAKPGAGIILRRTNSEVIIATAHHLIGVPRQNFVRPIDCPLESR